MSTLPSSELTPIPDSPFLALEIGLKDGFGQATTRHLLPRLASQ